EVEEWQPHAHEEFQQVGKVSRIAIGLLGASTVTHLISTWSDWNTYNVVHRYLGGMPNVTDADLNRADTISKITSIPNVVVSVAAAVVFVIWLWRARVNSEVFCQADHRRSHGWVLASWFCPGPNLWYPKQIVDDVWLASDPATPFWSDDLRRLEKPLLTKVWWCSWVGALAFDVVIRRFLMWMDPTVGSLRGIALAGTASLILTAASAIGATLVIRKITAMQTEREWMPWWDQREPRVHQLTSVPTYSDMDADATMLTPAVLPERQRELQLAGAAGPLQLSAAPAAQLSAVQGSQFPAGAMTTPLQASPLSSLPLGGGSPLAPEQAPGWSPFASVVESWQDPADSGPETQQFSPYDAWRDEPGPVEEAPAFLQPSAGIAPPMPTWSTSSNPYTPSDDLLSAPLPSWQAETVAPPSLTVVPPSVEPETPSSWAKSYVDSYETRQSSSDFLSPSAPIPTPEPAPAPAARPGRRAAKVAVDSPSAIQAAVSDNTHSASAGRGYTEQAPPLSSPLPDDFLTPSKPLPPVPSFGPEPSHTPGSSYSTPETAYTPSDSSYGSSYSPEPSYTPEPYQYSPEPTYNSETSYSSSYDSYSSDQSYDQYSSSTSYEAYSPESYSTPETTYTPSEPSYQSSYSLEPTYTPEPDTSYSSYSSADYSSDYSTPPAESSYTPQPSYLSYEAPAEPTANEKDDSEITAPRTHPRRRWV
ncbi:MAG: hypothetical protein QOG10_3610, partial [Kribbellaceae bacterium]|nr:hypothetical protein [Kribbellaceae bacterium]